MKNKRIKINFKGHNCELTRDKIKQSDVPNKHIYYIRHDDTEEPCTLENNVNVNYWGTLISDDIIALVDGDLHDPYHSFSRTEISELNESMNRIIFDE